MNIKIDTIYIDQCRFNIGLKALLWNKNGDLDGCSNRFVSSPLRDKIQTVRQRDARRLTKKLREEL